MKCKAKVIYYKNLKKDGSKRIFTTLPPHAHKNSPQFMSFINRLQPKKLEQLEVFAPSGQPLYYECQGNIIVTIGCHDEPTFGDHYAQLDVSFQCDTCGHNYYPQLPDDETQLNEWLNDLMEKMK